MRMLRLSEDHRHCSEHVQVQATDQSQALQCGQKVHRRENLPVWQAPANQGLQRHQMPGLNIDDRLKIRQQLILTLERIAQRTFAFDLIGKLAAQLTVEHRKAVTAGILDPVHGGVGIAQQVRWFVVKLGIGGDDADAARRKHHVAIDMERQVERREDALGDGRGHLQRCVRRQYSELVAAQARQQILLAQAAAQARRCLHQQLIPKMVTAAVIDQLETVQVEEHHHQFAAIAQTGIPFHLQALLQMAAVGQGRQGVVGVLVLQPGIELVEFTGTALHARFELVIGRQHRFGCTAPGHGGVDMARDEGQKFLITGAVADQPRIALHHQDAADHLGIEQRNPQPGLRADRIAGAPDLTGCHEQTRIVEVDQAGPPLTNHVFGQAAIAPAWRRRIALVFVDVVRKGHFLEYVVIQGNVEVARHQQLADDAVQACEQLLHVAALAGQFGNLEQRAVQVFGALTLGHFLAQGRVELREFTGALGDCSFQIVTVQNTVQGHRDVASDHKEQRAVFGTVDTRHVIDLHGNHAEYFVR